eukprot:2428866-Rhodomonas_salina.1
MCIRDSDTDQTRVQSAGAVLRAVLFRVRAVLFRVRAVLFRVWAVLFREATSPDPSLSSSSFAGVSLLSPSPSSPASSPSPESSFCHRTRRFRPRLEGQGSGLWSLGSRVKGLGSRVWGLGSRVWGLESRALGLGYRGLGSQQYQEDTVCAVDALLDQLQGSRVWGLGSI